MTGAGGAGSGWPAAAAGAAIHQTTPPPCSPGLASRTAPALPTSRITAARAAIKDHTVRALFKLADPART